jgi:hypothetical protein
MAHARRLTAGLLALLPAACGEVPAADALRALIPGGTEAVEAVPVPADGPLLLLVAPRGVALLPVGQAGLRQLWRGEGNVAVATEGARVVATAGLGQMLMASRLDGPDPLEDPRALAGREVGLRRLVDLADSPRDPGAMRFGLALDCTLRGAAQGAWIVVEERCAGEDLAFTSRYWAEAATGQVTRSEQWAGDRLPLLQIRMQGI